MNIMVPHIVWLAVVRLTIDNIPVSIVMDFDSFAG